MRGSTRPTGQEIRVVVWLLRHPAWALVPVFGLWAVVVWGATAVLSGLGGLVGAVVVWWRAHPASFDRWAAPRVRSVWRRWTVYRGRRWRGVVEDCELTRDNRRTGELLYPRVLRVRSATPSIDTLTVRVVRGQDPAAFTERLPALADALGAHQVAVSRTRPGVVTVIVERQMPFARALDAPAIPSTSADVDLRALDVGDTEYGQPFLIRIQGKQVLVVG
ncbi:cell division protein FtsK, partial [Pseudonocardia xinjiangensis]|nr:cell division protein FtsK [Pseudonocardia xinjiangensis]